MKEFVNIPSSQNRRFLTYSGSQQPETCGGNSGAGYKQISNTPDIDLGAMTVFKDSWRVARMAEVILSLSWGCGCVFPVNKVPYGGILDATDNIIPSEITVIKRYIMNRLFFLSWDKNRK